jgi:hypothetical protein
MNKQEILNDFGLLEKDGFLLGEVRIIDLGLEPLNKAIEKENKDIEFIGSRINAGNQNLFSRLINKILTFEQFSNGQRNERSNKDYKSDLDGYFEYLQDEKPKIANFFLDLFEPYFADNVMRFHKYITGSSDSGKSELLKSIIITHILKKNCSVVILDPHGDLARQIYKSKVFLDKEQADRLVIIEPNFDYKYTPIINIFDQFPTDNEFDNDKMVQEYTHTFATIFEDLGEKPTSRMTTILSHCITVILRKQDGNLWDLLRFMTKDNADLVALGKQDSNPATAQFFNGMFDDETYKHTKTGIYDRLQGLLRTQIFSNLTTGKSTVNIADCMNKNKVLVLNLSMGGIGAEVSQSFGRLLISIIQKAALQRDSIEDPSKRPITYLFIDEFQNYISDTIRKILDQLRKYKIYITLVNQFVGQDSEIDQTKSVLGNTKVKIIGQSSHSNSVLLAKEMNIKPEQITGLSKGKFWIQYPNAKTGKLNTIQIAGTTKYLDNSFAMENTAYNQLKIDQIKRFYVEIGKYQVEPIKAPQNEFTEERKPYFKANKEDTPTNKQKRSVEPQILDLDI